MDIKMVLKKTAQLSFKHSSLIADAVDKDFLYIIHIESNLSCHFFLLLTVFF